MLTRQRRVFAPRGPARRLDHGLPIGREQRDIARRARLERAQPAQILPARRDAAIQIPGPRRADRQPRDRLLQRQPPRRDQRTHHAPGALQARNAERRRVELAVLVGRRMRRVIRRHRVHHTGCQRRNAGVHIGPRAQRRVDLRGGVVAQLFPAARHRRVIQPEVMRRHLRGHPQPARARPIDRLQRRRGREVAAVQRRARGLG